MSNEHSLFIKTDDFHKISAMISLASERTREFLQNELDRASVVPDDRLPEGIVAIHSRVTYLDLETKKESTVTLVYPYDAKSEELKISILAPLGAALIGLKVGQKIRWPAPQGERAIQILAVGSDSQGS